MKPLSSVFCRSILLALFCLIVLGLLASAQPSVGSEIANISSRRVVSGDNVVVTGTEPFPVLVRVLGPSLGEAGRPDPLADPTLELHNADGIVISNAYTAVVRGLNGGTGTGFVQFYSLEARPPRELKPDPRFRDRD